MSVRPWRADRPGYGGSVVRREHHDAAHTLGFSMPCRIRDWGLFSSAGKQWGELVLNFYWDLQL